MPIYYGMVDTYTITYINTPYAYSMWNWLMWASHYDEVIVRWCVGTIRIIGNRIGQRNTTCVNTSTLEPGGECSLLSSTRLWCHVIQPH